MNTPMRLAPLLCAMALSACVAPLDGQFSCPPPDRSCPPDFFCHSDGVCRTAAEADFDAGARDASLDAFRADMNGHDSGELDAMPIDAPMIDAAMIDAPMIDAPGCSPASCETMDPCTTASCATGTCQLVNNTEACDDGVFCNGPDRCAGGTCSMHTGDPCDRAVSRCNEGTGACNPCGGFNQPCCDGTSCGGGRLCNVPANVCRCITGDCGTTGYCNGYTCLTPCGQFAGDVCCDLAPRCPTGLACDTATVSCL
jgi:hypothetical protein